MRFTVKYIPEDIYEANKLYRKVMCNKWVRFIPVFIGAFIGLLIVKDYIFSSETKNSLYWISLIVPLLIIMIAFFWLTKKRNPLAYKFAVRYLEQSKELHLPMDLEINERGLKVNNELGTGFMKWESFNKFGYNDKILILCHTTRVMRIFPKRSINSDRDWSDLISLIKRKITIK